MENEAVQRRFGANLRELRQRQRLGQADLAERLAALGVPLRVNLISRMENGSRIADVPELLALAVALGVTPNRLLLAGTASDDAEIALTPNVDVVERAGWEWASGNAPLSADDLPPGARADGDEEDFSFVNRPHQPPDMTRSSEIIEHLPALTELHRKAEDLVRRGVPLRIVVAYLAQLGYVVQLSDDADRMLDEDAPDGR